MKGEKAVEGAIARMKNRPSNKMTAEVEAVEFTDGVKSWGDWSNAPPPKSEQLKNLKDRKLPISK